MCLSHSSISAYYACVRYAGYKEMGLLGKLPKILPVGPICREYTPNNSPLYQNFEIHNTAWPHQNALQPDFGPRTGNPHTESNGCRLFSMPNGMVEIINCITDNDLTNKFNHWHHVYAHLFAPLLNESIDVLSGSLRDRAYRIATIRGRAVAKIRTLSTELRQPKNNGFLNSDNDLEIYNELKRLTNLKAQKIQEEKDRQHERELKEFQAAKEEAHTNLERAEKAEKTLLEYIEESNARFDKADQKIENLLKQIEAKEKHTKILKKREDRLLYALLDIFEYGETNDQNMAWIFDEACKISQEFKKLFVFLKSGPHIRQAFAQAKERLEEELWELLEEREEWQKLIDQPMIFDFAIGNGDEQTAIEDVGNPDDNNYENDNINEPESETKDIL